MRESQIVYFGDELYRALKQNSPVPPITERAKEVTIDEAYSISLRMLERRKHAGEVVVGKKIGVTSKVVQEMLGVRQPDFGFLTDTMQYDNGAEIHATRDLIQPRAEAEIGFKLKHDLCGTSITESDVLAATDYILPCFEIVDSRIKDWKIKIEDTVADNASCGVFVLGEGRADPRDYDLAALKIVVKKNGKFLSEGLGSAVQGNPLTAVAWLANTLGTYGMPLNSGEIILSGSLVPLENVLPGDRFEMELEGVGGARCHFV